MALEIEAFALTDVGVQRDHNEDAFDILPDHGMFVVADGMGGHASGQVASRLAVDNLRRYVSELAVQPHHDMAFPVRPGAGPREQLLSNAIQWANERIYIESLKERRLEGMGTTIVTALRDGESLVVGHVGDSRVYRYRQGELEQLTRDHSLLNHYIQQGRIRTEEEARNFKERNIIVKALGLKDYVEPDTDVADMAPGDLFLLCTDGLTDQVDDWIISHVLEGNYHDLPEACQAMVRLANDAGGKDNCTVMILCVRGELSADQKTVRRMVPAPAAEEGDEVTEPSMPAVTEDMLATEPAPPEPESAEPEPEPEPPESKTVPHMPAMEEPDPDVDNDTGDRTLPDLPAFDEDAADAPVGPLPFDDTMFDD